MRFLSAFHKRVSGKKRILLVDDEAGFTKLVRINLERTERFVIREENDPSRAVTTAVEFQPDLVVLDMEMSKNDGAQLSRQINGDPRLHNTRIVILTGTIPRETEKWDFPAYAKPITMEKLLEVIDGSLSPRRATGSS